jgi:hypothetical protein
MLSCHRVSCVEERSSVTEMDVLHAGGLDVDIGDDDGLVVVIRQSSTTGGGRGRCR